MSHPIFSRHLVAALAFAGLALTAPAQNGDPHAKPVFSSEKVARGPIPVKADLKGAKELHLVVTDAGDGFACDWADWIEPVLVKADGSKIKLTDLKPKATKAGWGEVRMNKNAGGREMKVRTAPVANGIGTHSPSLVSFDLPEGVIAFEAQGAVDDGGFDQGHGATVTFQVYTQQPPASVLVASSENDTGSREKPYGYSAAKSAMERDMKVADGLAVALFAAEPQIQNPTNIDIDHRGRVWAVEAVNYRSSFQKWGKLRDAGDRVVILEDTNGDGVADAEKTFWQSKDLQAPLGICVLPQERGTHVIVSAAPNVWLVSDTDGDDKADKVTKLFTVGGGWDHDHQVHAFLFGSDGKFYFNFGNECRELKDANGTVVTDIFGNAVAGRGKPYRQGMVLRCDIDLGTGKVSNVETLANNFRNNYEVTVDSFGTLWQSDNDDDGNKGVRINYVMEYGNYGYGDEMTGAGWQKARTNIETEIPKRHWHQNDPGVVPNLLQTGGGSPTGILVNEGTLLGERFTNQIIHCDAGPRVVRAYPVENDGAGYKATMVDILTSNDSWYRPSDAAIAPDGSLVVSDWYDPGVGGHNMGDRDAEKIRGRIYRVAPKAGTSRIAAPSFAKPAECVAALMSPNRATQYVAWQKLRAMGAQGESELQKLAKHENPRFRARAIGVLAHLPGRAVDALRTGLTDNDANVRIATIRLARSLAKTGGLDTTPLEEDRPLLGKLVRDPNPQVRREIALSLYGAKKIADLWAALAAQHDSKDRWYLEALGIGSTGNEDACFDAWLQMVNGNWNTPAGRDIIWRLRSAKSAEYLAKVLTEKAAPDTELPRYLRAFDFLPPSPEKNKALVQLAALGPQSKMIATEALQRLKNVNLNTNAELKNALNSMLVAAKGQPEFVELVRDFNIKDQGEGLLAVAIKDPSSPAGVEAAKMLLDSANVNVAVNALKTGDASRFVEALGNTADQRAAALLAPLLTDASKALDLRKQAVKALAHSQAGVQALLNLARQNQFPAELKLVASGALAAVQMPQFKNDIAQFFPMPSAAGGKALPPIAELARSKGDAARGKEIFGKMETTCITCHRVGQLGTDFGPGLAEIGSKLGKDALFEAIIAPNAGVSMGFETTQLTLKSGDTALGIVRSETEDELMLAMPGGVQNRYKKSDVAKREKLTYSMMPEGLQAMLPTQDFIDLVEYLSSLKAPQQQAAR
ncbi:PVC-type heme-binding CxxCH protein [Verrucomicrobiota bacterium sgz303538]